KIQFVATVLHQPKLIILDEPFSGFDPINANIIKDEILSLRDQGSTIIFSTHRMESVEELCDHVALMNKSRKVLDGSKAELKEQYKTNSFSVEYSGELSGKPGFFELLGTTHVADGFYKGTVKLNDGVSINDLIRSMIDQVEVKSFHENIPSMNEIFIAAVNQS